MFMFRGEDAGLTASIPYFYYYLLSVWIEMHVIKEQVRVRLFLKEDCR